MAIDEQATQRVGRRRTARRARSRARSRLNFGRVLGGLGASTEAGERSSADKRTRENVRRGRWAPQPDQVALIASLVEAGVMLDVAFDTLATMGGTRGTRVAASQVRDALRSGRTLSDALNGVGVRDHVRALVHGGERVGIEVAPDRCRWIRDPSSAHSSRWASLVAQSHKRPLVLQADWSHKGEDVAVKAGEPLSAPFDGHWGDRSD